MENKLVKWMIDEGYKYLFVSKRSRKSFSVSKDDLITDDSLFDVYHTVDDEELNCLKQIKKGVLISLL